MTLARRKVLACSNSTSLAWIRVLPLKAWLRETKCQANACKNNSQRRQARPKRALFPQHLGKDSVAQTRCSMAPVTERGHKGSRMCRVQRQWELRSLVPIGQSPLCVPRKSRCMCLVLRPASGSDPRRQCTGGAGVPGDSADQRASSYGTRSCLHRRGLRR